MSHLCLLLLVGAGVLLAYAAQIELRNVAALVGVVVFESEVELVG